LEDEVFKYYDNRKEMVDILSTDTVLSIM